MPIKPKHFDDAEWNKLDAVSQARIAREAAAIQKAIDDLSASIMECVEALRERALYEQNTLN